MATCQCASYDGGAHKLSNTTTRTTPTTMNTTAAVQKQKKTKRQQGKQTKRQKDKKTKRQKTKDKRQKSRVKSHKSKTKKKENEKGEKNSHFAFDVIQKNARSLHNGDRFEELTKEVEGCKWDAFLLCETWRTAKSELWKSPCGHVYMGAGGCSQKHGVGTLTAAQRTETKDNQVTVCQ